MKARLLPLVLILAGCTTAPPPGSTPVPGGASRAPYDSPRFAGNGHAHARPAAAREILALLSRPRFDPEAAKSLADLPAVKAAIRESNRSAEVFQTDLAAAFDDQARIAVFDFRGLRENAARWADLLAMIAAREAELTKLASDRVRALLPPDVPVSVIEPIYLTFGLPGRADHLVVPSGEGADWYVVIDMARALSDAQSSPPSEQIKHLSRLMASEGYQRAWAEYRAASPAWQKRDTAFGQLEPLMRQTAQAGPVALYSVDENFFRCRSGSRRGCGRGSTSSTAPPTGSFRRRGISIRASPSPPRSGPEFTARVAAPAGAFLADGIIQTWAWTRTARRWPTAPRLLRSLRARFPAERPRADPARQGDTGAAGGRRAPPKG